MLAPTLNNQLAISALARLSLRSRSGEARPRRELRSWRYRRLPAVAGITKKDELRMFAPILNCASAFDAAEISGTNRCELRMTQKLNQKHRRRSLN